MKNMKELKEAIALIKKYVQILKTQNKKIINITGKQGQKCFRDPEDFMETVGLIQF